MSHDVTLAILAGAGEFPLHVACEARRQGRRVIGFGIAGWADASLASHVDVYEEVAIGQLGRLIERLKAHQARQMVMAGKVTKEVLLHATESFDAEALAIVVRAGGNMSAPALLGAVGKRLSREGVTLIDSSAFLKESLCPAGILTARRPTPSEEDDIHLGARAARTMAGLDVGQTVVVRHGVIVAVEALEGTDAAVQRAGQLVGPGSVVVKTGAPKQDRRFDLPVVGVSTIQVMAAAGATCLAVEAGTTLLLDRPAVLEAAKQATISVVGLRLKS